MKPEVINKWKKQFSTKRCDTTIYSWQKNKRKKMAISFLVGLSAFVLLQSDKRRTGEALRTETWHSNEWMNGQMARSQCSRSKGQIREQRHEECRCDGRKDLELWKMSEMAFPTCPTFFLSLLLLRHIAINSTAAFSFSDFISICNFGSCFLLIVFFIQTIVEDSI